MTVQTGDVQMTPRDGVIELAFGEPDPGLLPVDLVRRCADEALTTAGSEMLAYGASAGAGSVRLAVRDFLAEREQREPDLDEVVITGGISAALDLLLTLLLERGDVVFIEQPTYSLALHVLQDHGARLEPVPMDSGGMVVEELASRLRAVRAAGRRPRLVYTVPTYHNPTGVCLSPDRRRLLLDVAAAEDLLVIEDDAYRELWYDRPSPPSLWSLDTAGVAVRLGTTSKTIAPGLRTGWLTARRSVAALYAGAGLLDSGGAVSHFCNFVAGRFLTGAGYDDHVAGLRREYGRRRDALVLGLAESLPPACALVRPEGGFFVRVTLPDGLSADDLLAPALAAGVSFVPGTRNQLSDGGEGMRLGFTYYGAPELAEGARRLGAVIAAALAER